MVVSYRGSSCAHQMVHNSLNASPHNTITLQLSRESRQEWLKTYQPSFAKTCSSKTVVDANLSLDMVTFDCETSQTPLAFYSRRAQHYLEAGELGEHLLAKLPAPAGPAMGQSSCRIIGIGDASFMGWEGHPQR
jgi:hypothetical protein